MERVNLNNRYRTRWRISYPIIIRERSHFDLIAQFAQTQKIQLLRFVYMMDILFHQSKTHLSNRRRTYKWDNEEGSCHLHSAVIRHMQKVSLLWNQQTQPKKHKKYTVKGQSSTLREGTADGNRKERDYGDIADTSISNNRTTNHSPNAHLP